MNMNSSPTAAQLQQLFSAANDQAGHHSLWIDTSGKVHLSQIPPELTPVGFAQAQPTMRVRFETFNQGAGYVGPKAAADAKYMTDTLNRLVRAWTTPFPTNGVKYVDY